jgi:uncharacterized phage protein gp47/JayE
MGIDLPGFTDLVLAEEDPNVIVAAALTAMQTAFPGYQPREGQTEVVLLEQEAVMTAELGYAVNRVPAQTTESVLNLYGLVRSPGTYAVSTARFSVSTSTVDVTIPSGTQFSVTDATGTDITFSTAAPLTIPAGTTLGTVDVQAIDVGSDPNGIAAGTAGTMITAVPYVDSVTLTVISTSGSDPEDQAAFLDRGVPRLSRLVQTLVRPEHFTAAALETVGVSRALTLDKYNSDGPSSAPVNNTGTDPGHVTVAVAAQGGAPLSNLALDAMRVALQSQAFVLLTVHAINATLVNVDVTATVVAQAGFTVAEVQQNVAVALDAYLSPDSWPWTATVYRNELISLIDGVIGVSRVVSIDAPAADLVLSGVAPLPVLGTAMITVQTS